MNVHYTWPGGTKHEVCLFFFPTASMYTFNRTITATTITPHPIISHSVIHSPVVDD